QARLWLVVVLEVPPRRRRDLLLLGRERAVLSGVTRSRDVLERPWLARGPLVGELLRGRGQRQRHHESHRMFLRNRVITGRERDGALPDGARAQGRSWRR